MNVFLKLMMCVALFGAAPFVIGCTGASGVDGGGEVLETEEDYAEYEADMDAQEEEAANEE